MNKTLEGHDVATLCDGAVSRIIRWDARVSVLALTAVIEATPGTVVLFDELPPPYLLNQATRGRLQLGVYIPSDGEHTIPILGPALPVSESVELLRRLHLLKAQPVVVADAAAIADALHFAELVAPISARLVVLGSATARAAIEAAYAQARAPQS